MISSGQRKTTVVVSWGRGDKQMLAEVRTIVGELWRGEDPSKPQHLRDKSSLGGRKRTEEGELPKSREKKASKK